MNRTDCFFDTNVLLYLLSADEGKARIAEQLLTTGGVVSIQGLNEFASVASRKLSMAIAEIKDGLTVVKSFCDVEPLSMETHELGLSYCSQFGYSVYDAMILATATLADSHILFSEDFQSDQQITSNLTIRNPFRQHPS